MTQPKPLPPSVHFINQHSRTLRQLIHEYLDALVASGYSPRTHENYRERLLPFVMWCEERGVVHAPQVSLAVLESYQRYLRSYRKASGQLLVQNSQLNRLSALKSWFRWLLKRHIILYNPAEQMVLPKEEKRLPAQVFSAAETRQVLNAQDISQPLALRDRAIMELFWSTGIRRMELGNLRLSDVDFGRGVLLVQLGKGKKDRVVPVGSAALAWLARYLDAVRPQLAYQQDSGHLFLSNKGSGLAEGTLTMIGGRAIREKAKLDKPGACHIFRHSMATQMLENGADTRHIQAILGHEKLETTQIYTRVAIGYLKKVHEATHPAEQADTLEGTASQEPEAEAALPESR